jgi:hypothetical protein
VGRTKRHYCDIQKRFDCRQLCKKINLVLHRKKPIVSDIGVAFDDDTEGKKRLSSSANGKKGKCLIDDDMM